MCDKKCRVRFRCLTVKFQEIQIQLKKSQGRFSPKYCANKVNIFKGLILDCPYYIFVSYNRSLYHRSVTIFSNEWCSFLNSRSLAFVKYFQLIF